MWKLIFIGLVAFATAEKVRYDNYKVFRLVPRTEEQLDIVKNLEDVSDSFSFWKEPSQVQKSVDVMVAPPKVPEFQEIMKQYDIPCETYVENVQALIEPEKPAAVQGFAPFNLNGYNKLDDIYTYLDNLGKFMYDNVEVIVGGKTHEGREIKGVKVSFGEKKPGIFVEGGIHGREWISPAAILYMLNELLFSPQANVRELAESHDWYIFPVFNPDGYEYTHTTNRLWKKTRKPYSIFCSGADPNRNWDYKWMSVGASTRACAENYAGKAAFSDIETKSLSQYIASISDKFSAYIAFHSYSQVLVFPYGDTAEHLENYDDSLKIGQKTVEALAKRYGTIFQTGNVFETTNAASGSSMDWVKKTLKKEITFTYELRDSGYGFLPPAEQIAPTALETLDSLIAMSKEMKALKN